MTREDKYLIDQIRTCLSQGDYHASAVFIDRLIERFEDIYDELKRRERAE